MFVMRLSHSGRAVHVCFPGEGQEAFLEGHTLAFGRLGGVPRRVRYDNLKAAVTRVLAGRERIESDRFTALRSHFGFDVFFCEPGIAGAHEKGGVEGEVGRFRRRHLVPVPRVESLAELNALLEAADRADDARHIAGRLATVGQMAEAEQPALRPLPAEPFDPTVALQAKADRKARISVRGSRYSVPAAYAGRTVDVRLGGGTVTAFLGGEQSQHDLAVVRARDALVRSRTLLINHVRGAVKACGAALPSCTAGAFHRKAAEHIPDGLRPALLPLVEAVGELTARIAAAGREVEALCEAHPETAALRQVTGVGPITALTFVLTVEDPGRFPQNREVSLCFSSRPSGS